MKVINQYVVKEGLEWQILYETASGWFITTTGAFGQREMKIIPCNDNLATKLIKDIATWLTQVKQHS